ncbi:MAG: guanylate kinase [Deltaproteobacteria bacterium]|nr:guanylate kinase [Deltaproteobacteria bacterium]
MSDDPDTDFTFARQGILFIISAPSGAGKTTLASRLFQAIPDLRPSISYTTRAPRVGEVDGRDYHFVSEDHFVRMRDAEAFAEWAYVHDFYYGTPRAPVDEAIAEGRDLLLDIDVQGAKQLKGIYPEAVSLFVLPPSWQALEQRLRGRGTDSEAVITRRLHRAREEAHAFPMYDYWIVNDDIDRAVSLLHAILIAERARVARLRTRSIA